MEIKGIGLDTDIQFLKGVGPKMAELLSKLGIYKIKDLMEYYPRTYEDRTRLYKISQLVIGENCLFLGAVKDKLQVKRIRKNLAIYSTYVYDDTGVCKMTWFNQAYMKDRLKPGMTYLFLAK